MDLAETTLPPATHRVSRPVGLRWTIGDVSDRGFEALRLSIWGAWQIFGARAGYAVCVNTVDLRQARARTGTLPCDVRWLEVGRELPPFLEEVFGRDMAEGVAWKLTPLQLFPDRWEIALDNDCILWRLPAAMQDWLAEPAQAGACLIAEDVRPCHAQFADLCPREPRNSGIRGLPPGFDLAAALREVLERRRAQTGSRLQLTSELDEQGMQVAALWTAGPLHVVGVRDVSICSPFHPHLPDLGTCGAHFVGLNARHIPWNYYDRPAHECMTEHWERHREVLYQRTATPIGQMAQGAATAR